MSTSQNLILSSHKLATKQTTHKCSRSSSVDFRRRYTRLYTSWTIQRLTKHGDEQPSNNRRSGCICSPSSKEGKRLTVFNKQAGHEISTSIGFSHPHPGIQTQWTPRPGPGFKVVSRSLTTLQSTKKTRNHRSSRGKGTIARNKNAEEGGTYQR
jgi:hypothetical protein